MKKIILVAAITAAALVIGLVSGMDGDQLA